MGEGLNELKEPEVGNPVKVFTEWDKATVLTNSLQLWSPAQDMCKSNPVSTAAGQQGASCSGWLLEEEVLCWLAMPWWMVPNP